MNIITNYEEQLKQRENTETTAAAMREKMTALPEGEGTQKDGNKSQEEEYTADLSQLVAGSPTYEGPYTQVLTYTNTLTPRKKSRGTKNRKKSKESKEMMTLREFTEQKS